MSADRPETHGFRKPLSNPKPESVRIATIHTEAATILCSCGWAVSHARTKVRENSAQSHVDKRHDGRALWM